MNAEFVQVVALLPDRTPPDARARPAFYYAVPDRLAGSLLPGHFVLVPFGKHAGGKERLVSGIVFSTDVGQGANPSYTLKPIEDLLDPQPVVSEAHLRLAQWMADEYVAPLCECVRPFAPPGQTIHSDLEYALVPCADDRQPPLLTAARGQATPDQPVPQLGSLQSRIVAVLGERGPLRAGQLSAALRRKDWQTAARPLVAHGLVTATRVLPLPRTHPKMVRFVELAPAANVDRLGNTEDTIQRRRRALDFLRREGRSMEVEWVYAESGCTAADLKFLEEKGLIRVRLQEVMRDPLGGQEFVLVTPPALTADQAAVWQRIRAGLEQTLPTSLGQPSTASHLVAMTPCRHVTVSSRPPVYLLHGVTGSGKTEIYLRAVDETLRAGKQAIVLVPEISLTPQTVRRFTARFPGRVAVWHSQMSQDEKYDTWRRIRAGAVEVVVGARSALFSPLERLGLIVMDEEHESSYKQDIDSDLPFELPPYHARETALELARLTGSVVIMGSATPSLEAYTRAQRGEFELLALPQRILSLDQRVTDIQAPKTRFTDLPPVQVVDMRQELRAGNRHIFSRLLRAALGDVLKNKQQAILFLNRRGSATFVLCRDCGHVMTCPHCDIPLTYHENAQYALMCHQCNHREPIPDHCPKCGSARIKYFGLGTQRVEKAVNELFPHARVLRWDADTAAVRSAHAIFLQQFIEGQADVMVGTQMIAKGLDLPLVTLVGVVSADTNLHLPDFRAAERTFQLMAQVAGRAGRGPAGGRVIVQTYTPEHYAIQRAAQHDYAGFARQELAFRRQMDYPPFTRLARLIVRHADPRRAQREAGHMAAALLPHLEAVGADERALVGPAPCFLSRLHDEYRWQIILRVPDPAAILRSVSLSQDWRVDIDPVGLL